MTMLEILKERKAMYECEIEKNCFLPDVVDDNISRIAELNNLIFIIATQTIDGVK